MSVLQFLSFLGDFSEVTILCRIDSFCFEKKEVKCRNITVIFLAVSYVFVNA